MILHAITEYSITLDHTQIHRIIMHYLERKLVFCCTCNFEMLTMCISCFLHVFTITSGVSPVPTYILHCGKQMTHDDITVWYLMIWFTDVVIWCNLHFWYYHILSDILKWHPHVHWGCKPRLQDPERERPGSAFKPSGGIYPKLHDHRWWDHLEPKLGSDVRTSF